MKSTKIVALALVCLGSQPAIAAEGWQKLSWGMSPDQVKALYPDALAIDADFGVKSCRSGSVGKWGLAYDTGGRRFNAMFCFNADDKLESVGLKLKPPLDGASLAADLERKYGAPETNVDKGELIAFEKWRDGGTVILFTEIRKPDWVYGAPAITFKTNSVSITYYAAVASDNSGL